MNVNSVLSKLPELKALISINNYDVICLQETKIDKSISNDELQIPGFAVFRRDRTRNGSGLAIFVRSSLHVTPLKDSKDQHLELLAVKIRCSGSFLTIVNVYNGATRSNSDFVDSLGTYMAKLSNCAQSMILVGDFNLDPTSAESSMLTFLTDTYKCRQLVSETTHGT